MTHRFLLSYIEAKAMSDEQPCFAGLLAYAFGKAAELLASLHHTVKKHSLQALKEVLLLKVSEKTSCI